jgi:formiminotetrahydrofolate cyclodeaminase
MMNKNLTELTVGELLRKFGAGNHKPGSGSASALEGMLSAQMLLTVVDLTNEPRRSAQYADHADRLLRIKEEIETRIYPRLEKLFQDDSEQFDKVIKHRNERDAERDPVKKRALSEQEKDLLRIATEIPIEIAELCLESAGFAEEIFDHGFRSARGDAGVALNGALACVISCLSIIELNLQSLPADEWMDRIVKKKADIRASYNKVASLGDEKLKVLESESEKNRKFHQAMAKFRQGNLEVTIRSDAQLEKLVREFQNQLWTHRENIWKRTVPDVPIEVLQPRVVLEKVLGYAYYESANLGTHEVNGELFETAGIIDKRTKSVSISTNFPLTSQRFSLAHELAHAILHEKTILHRDKSIDGPGGSNRSLEERQADKFAAYFLIPETALQLVFEGVFHIPVFEINEATTLALRAGNPFDFRKRCGSLRGLARAISSAEFFAGKSFNSLATVFDVSNETMAIRLEELKLVSF